MALAGELGLDRDARLAAATNILCLDETLPSFNCLSDEQATVVIVAFGLRRREQLKAAESEEDPF